MGAVVALGDPFGPRFQRQRQSGALDPIGVAQSVAGTAQEPGELSTDVGPRRGVGTVGQAPAQIREVGGTGRRVTCSAERDRHVGARAGAGVGSRFLPRSRRVGIGLVLGPVRTLDVVGVDSGDERPAVDGLIERVRSRG